MFVAPHVSIDAFRPFSFRGSDDYLRQKVGEYDSMECTQLML